MPESLAPGRQDGRATVLGWVMAVTFLALLWNILQLPRTPLDERGLLRAVHDSLGLVVLGLAGFRLYWWFKGPKPEPPAGLPAGSFAFNRALLMALILTFGVTGIIGFFYAWGESGRQVVLFGLAVPQPFPKGETLRKSAGYLHSALSFYYLMLFGVWLAFGCYQHIRYRAGLLRLLPGSRV